MLGYLVVDFDSTFVAGEAFDELADLMLTNAVDRIARVAEIAAITRAGMEGRIGFDESLRRRIGALRPDRASLGQLVERLRGRVTPSVVREREWILEHADRMYVISGGFREFVVPVVQDFGIAADHVLANQFTWDGDRVVGVMPGPLAASNGKTASLRELGLPGPVVMVGDALSDYAPREQGVADAFVLLTENIERPGLADKADAVAANFSEVIHFAKGLGKSTTLGKVAKL